MAGIAAMALGNLCVALQSWPRRRVAADGEHLLKIGMTELRTDGIARR